jgi:hypothetical protein
MTDNCACCKQDRPSEELCRRCKQIQNSLNEAFSSSSFKPTPKAIKKAIDDLVADIETSIPPWFEVRVNPTDDPKRLDIVFTLNPIDTPDNN